MTEKQKAYLALASICIIWGVTWVVSRHAILLGNFPPLQLTSTRQFFAGLCFCGFFFIKGQGLPPKKDWPKLTILSLLMFVGSNGLSTIGVKSIGSGLGSILAALTSLWLAVLGYFILKQKINKTTVIGLMLGFVGLLVVFYEHLYQFADADFTLGIILSIVATFTWSIGTIYTVKHSLKGNAYYNVGWQMLISSVFLFGLSFFDKRVPYSQVNYMGWIDLAILVIGGSIITFIAYMYLLKRLPAAQVSIFVYVNPIIAMIISSRIFPDEKITPTLGIGAAITLLGVYLVNSSFKVKKED